MSQPPAPLPQPGPAISLGAAPRVLTTGGKWLGLKPKDAALLALVALRGEVSRRDASRWLFPRSVEVRAGTALRQRLHQLHKAVGAVVLVSDGTVLRLATGVRADLHAPRERLRLDPRAYDAQLLGGIDIGPLKALATELQSENAGWRNRVKAALIELAHEHDGSDRFDDAIQCLECVVDQDPLLEVPLLRLMRLQWRKQQRAAALRAYERYRRALKRTLGESPSAAALELADQIRRDEPGPGQAAEPALPQALQHPPRTFGRAALVGQALELLDEQGLVLLVGPPGIGKSRLLDDLLRREATHVSCRAQWADRDNDLALLCALVMRLRQTCTSALPQDGPADRAISADLTWLSSLPRGAPPSPPMRTERLMRALDSALLHARRAGVRSVAIDDLHFADTASLNVLCAVLRPRKHGLRFVLASRDAPLPAPLVEWLEACEDVSPELRLPPIDTNALVEWIDSLRPLGPDPAQWVPALDQHCGGHPLSVLLVLRTLHAQGFLAHPGPPPKLPVPQQAITRAAQALARSDSQVQSMAFVAALAGPDFDDQLAMKVLDCTAVSLLAPWYRLESLGMFRGRGFSHELMRQAVADAVPRALAPSVHRNIALALVERPQAITRRAEHWEAAGEAALAADDHRLAADQALAAGLMGPAQERLLRAATLYDRAGRRDAAFQTRWWMHRATRGAWTMAEGTSQARALLGLACNPLERAQALCQLAASLTEQHDPAGLTAAQEAVELARTLDRPDLRSGAELCLASAERLVGLWPQALARVDRLLDEPSSVAVEDIGGAQTLRAALLADNGQYAAAASALGLLLEQAVAQGDWHRAAEQACYLVLRLGDLCQLSRAREIGLRGSRFSRDAGYHESMCLVDDMNMACMCADLGRFDEAIGLAESAAEGLRRLGHLGYLISVENLLAGVFLTLARPDLAVKRLGEPAAEAPLWARAMRRAAQARYALARGGQGLPDLIEALASLDAGGVVKSPDVRHRLALEVARWGDPSDAIVPARSGAEWAATRGHVAIARLARLVELEALVKLKRCSAAASAAARFEAEIGGHWEFSNLQPPEVWIALCRAWDLAGDRPRSTALATLATSWIERTAHAHVAPLFRSNYLKKNPVNAWLCRRAITDP